MKERFETENASGKHSFGRNPAFAFRAIQALVIVALLAVALLRHAVEPGRMHLMMLVTPLLVATASEVGFRLGLRSVR